jgi:hypothetical protein
LPVESTTFESAPNVYVEWDGDGVDAAAELILDVAEHVEPLDDFDVDALGGEHVKCAPPLESDAALEVSLPCSSLLEDDEDNAFTIPLPTFELTPCREAIDEVAEVRHAEPIPALAAELRHPVSETPPPVTLLDVRSDVSDLAESFSVQETEVGPDLCRALRELAGLEMTPGTNAVTAPPSAETKAR